MQALGLGATGFPRNRRVCGLSPAPLAGVGPPPPSPQTELPSGPGKRGIKTRLFRGRVAFYFFVFPHLRFYAQFSCRVWTLKICNGFHFQFVEGKHIPSLVFIFGSRRSKPSRNDPPHSLSSMFFHPGR